MSNCYRRSWLFGSNLVDALVKKNIKVTVIDNLSTGQTKISKNQFQK